MTVQKKYGRLSRTAAAAAAVMFLLMSFFSLNVSAAADYCKDWKSFKSTYGKPDSLTWNVVVDAMEDVLDAAQEMSDEGDTTGAYNALNDAYYGYYEITGFEKVTMGSLSGSRVSAMEFQFKDCKMSAQSGDKTATKEKIDTLRSMLREDANKLDGTSDVTRQKSWRSGRDFSTGEAVEASKSDEQNTADDDDDAIVVKTNTNGFDVARFSASFTIILREGLEAILIVGAIIAYLVKSGNKDKLKMVYGGAILAILASFAAAVLFNRLKIASTANQEIIEGVTAILAVFVLFYVSNWMISKAEADAWNKYIDDQVKGSMGAGNALALGFTAFLAVFREGAEVILFYQPLVSGNSDSAPVWIGFGIGCVTLVVVYVIIRYFSVKLPIRPFFLATSILMFAMSIAFLGSGIKELIEGDIISMTSPEFLKNLIPMNDAFDILGIYPILETLIPQLILVMITLMIFVMQGWKQKRKNEAGVLAIVLGTFGIHKFYLGKYGQGLLYIAFCWTFIPTVISIAEGVHYLTGTQEQFESELAPKKKTAVKKEKSAGKADKDNESESESKPEKGNETKAEKTAKTAK